MIADSSLFSKRTGGGILLLTLVLLMAFLVMFLALSRYIATESRAVALQRTRERSFQIAEAGVAYTQWLLNDAGYTPLTLPEVASYPVTDPDSQETAGSFCLAYTIIADPSGDIVEVASVGAEAHRPDIQQEIVARFALGAGGYALSAWDHRASASFSCGSAPQASM